MTKLATLGFAIDLAHRAGRAGVDLTAAEVTRIVDEATRMAMKPMPSGYDAIRLRGRMIVADEVDGPMKPMPGDQPFPGRTLSVDAIALACLMRHRGGWASVSVNQEQALKELIGLVEMRSLDGDTQEFRIAPRFHHYLDDFKARQVAGLESDICPPRWHPAWGHELGD